MAEIAKFCPFMLVIFLLRDWCIICVIFGLQLKKTMISCMYGSLIRIDWIILYGFIEQKRLNFLSISKQNDHCDTKGYVIVNRESSPALYASTHLTDLLSYCCSRIVDFGSKRAKNIQSLIQPTCVCGRSSHDKNKFYRI